MKKNDYVARFWDNKKKEYQYFRIGDKELQSPWQDDYKNAIFENDLIIFENESIVYRVIFANGKFDLEYYCDLASNLDYNYAGDFPFYDLDYYVKNNEKKCYVIGNMKEGIK